MNRVQKFVSRVNAIVGRMKKPETSDGHCTFGYEFRYGESEEPLYFATLDLNGSFFWTGKSMEEVLKKAEKHLDSRHR